MSQPQIKENKTKLFQCADFCKVSGKGVYQNINWGQEIVSYKDKTDLIIQRKYEGLHWDDLWVGGNA